MNETKLTLRIVVDGDLKEVSIHNDRWDTNIFEMADMFESLLLAAGYHPDSIEEILK
jgi:hypothetical protein